MRKIACFVVLSTILLVTACTPGNPWTDAARDYAASIDAPQLEQTADYIATACEDPNRSPADLSKQVGGTWDDVSGTDFSGFGEAVSAVCPEQFEDYSG